MQTNCCKPGIVSREMPRSSWFHPRNAALSTTTTSNVQHEGFTAWTVRIGNIRLIITIIIERASPKWNVLSCLSPKLARILLPSNSLHVAP
jgi:hypothetical protein